MEEETAEDLLSVSLGRGNSSKIGIRANQRVTV